MNTKLYKNYLAISTVNIIERYYQVKIYEINEPYQDSKLIWKSNVMYNSLVNNLEFIEQNNNIYIGVLERPRVLGWLKLRFSSFLNTNQDITWE